MNVQARTHLRSDEQTAQKTQGYIIPTNRIGYASAFSNRENNEEPYFQHTSYYPAYKYAFRLLHLTPNIRLRFHFCEWDKYYKFEYKDENDNNAQKVGYFDVEEENLQIQYFYTEFTPTKSYYYLFADGPDPANPDDTEKEFELLPEIETSMTRLLLSTPASSNPGSGPVVDTIKELWPFYKDVQVKEIIRAFGLNSPKLDTEWESGLEPTNFTTHSGCVWNEPIALFKNNGQLV
jgi:hypothetical protein